MTDFEKKAEEILQGYEQARSMNCMSLNLSRKEIIKAICDGIEQGQKAKSLEVICKDCSVQKQISKQCDELLNENADLKTRLQITEHRAQVNFEESAEAESKVRELEKENAEWKEFIRFHAEDCKKTLEHYLSKINQLEKENAELKAELETAQECIIQQRKEYEQLDKKYTEWFCKYHKQIVTVSEQQKQIEKMKRYCNNLNK